MNFALDGHSRRLRCFQKPAPQGNRCLHSPEREMFSFALQRRHPERRALASGAVQDASATAPGGTPSDFPEGFVSMARSFPHAARAAAVALALFSAGAASAQRDAAAPRRGEQRTAEGLLARGGKGSFGPVKFDAGDAPFGLRNNNWVSLKGPNLDGRWPGQTGANPHGFAHFDDPAYAIRGFVELIRLYQDKHNARSAAAIMKRYSPPGDCSGAPSIPASERRDGGGCPENESTPPVTAVRVARAVGLKPTDSLDLFGPNGQINHPDRLRVLLDAIVTQEIGPSHCPQPPRGESWIGCRVDDGLFNRAVELLGERRGPTEAAVSR
jgi:hypothetical protein